MNLLNRLTDELLSSQQQNPSSLAQETASDRADILGSLARELAVARRGGFEAGNRWCVVQTGVKGLLLLALRPEPKSNSDYEEEER